MDEKIYEEMTDEEYMKGKEFEKVIRENPCLLTNLISIKNTYKALLDFSDEKIDKTKELLNDNVDSPIYNYLIPILKLTQEERDKNLINTGHDM